MIAKSIPRQCKDIPDGPILELLAKADEPCLLIDREYSAVSVFWAMPDETPWKLALAKMRRLMQRGLVDGCDCGCRGDFRITKKGLGILRSMSLGLGEC